jgi:hypothetical protein
MRHGRSGCQSPRKVEPENEAWWVSLAYAVRRIESIEKAEAILLRAQAIHPKVRAQTRSHLFRQRITLIIDFFRENTF